MRLEEEMCFAIYSRVDLVLAKIPCIFTVLRKTPYLSPDSRIYIKNSIIESNALPHLDSSSLFIGFPLKSIVLFLYFLGERERASCWIVGALA